MPFKRKRTKHPSRAWLLLSDIITITILPTTLTVWLHFHLGCNAIRDMTKLKTMTMLIRCEVVVVVIVALCMHMNMNGEIWCHWIPDYCEFSVKHLLPVWICHRHFLRLFGLKDFRYSTRPSQARSSPVQYSCLELCNSDMGWESNIWIRIQLPSIQFIA